MREPIWSHDPSEVLLTFDAEHTNIHILLERANPAILERVRKQTL